MLPSIFEFTGCVTYLLSNIAIISPYIAEYSYIIAKFDFLRIYIRNYGIFTSSNIEYGNFFLVFDVLISV
jgi:hypothetical protein